MLTCWMTVRPSQQIAAGTGDQHFLILSVKYAQHYHQGELERYLNLAWSGFADEGVNRFVFTRITTTVML